MDNSDMTTIKFRMSQEEFYAGIASLSPETRKRFIADLLASDPGWAPYLEGIDLEAPGSGTIYRCGACGFETGRHQDLKECVKEFDAHHCGATQHQGTCGWSSRCNGGGADWVYGYAASYFRRLHSVSQLPPSVLINTGRRSRRKGRGAPRRRRCASAWWVRPSVGLEGCRWMACRNHPIGRVCLSLP
jgi:hypothetical protein